MTNEQTQDESTEAIGKGIDRRDFMKAGAITMGAIGLAGIIDLAGADSLFDVDDGGFYIRYHDDDDPPFEVDASYARHDGSNTSFTRNPESNALRSEVSAKNLDNNRGGSDRLAQAYSNAAALYMFDNSMYSWTADAPTVMGVAASTDRWVPEDDGYTPQEVTQIVKHSAKFYGASLVGIAPLDERWFYSQYANMEGDLTAMLGGAGGMESMPGQNPEMMQQMLGNMAPDELREMLGGAMEGMDPEALPGGMDPETLLGMPDEMLQQMLPQLLEQAEPEMLEGLMGGMDPGGDGSSGGMAAMLGGSMPATNLSFSDDVDAPVITDEEKIIPRSMNRVIVMAFEMDPESMDRAVSLVADSGTQMAYSRMAITTSHLAGFIRGLGYNAIPMGNDTSLSQPMAVDAGLGEIGRNSLLITPKFGPRVRLAKVLTDMPLETDRRISFGVTEFCEACKKCAELCPSGSLSDGDRTYEVPESGNPGFYHWPVDGDGCFHYWAEVGGSCSTCIRVCPFNKPEGWLHEATRILIGVKAGPLNSLLLNLDDASGYGGETGSDPDGFWEQEAYIHIKTHA